MFKFKILLAILAVSTLIRFYGPGLTETDHDHDHETVQHYEGEMVETTEAAKVLLTEKITLIGNILGKAKLEASDLEAIHEHSYSLETAIDKLRADKAATETLIDTTDEAIQAIHYASENHEEAKTREWFKILKLNANRI